MFFISSLEKEAVKQGDYKKLHRIKHDEVAGDCCLPCESRQMTHTSKLAIIGDNTDQFDLVVMALSYLRML